MQCFLKNLIYGYANGAEVFNNFYLNILGGSRIALVGPSGGGKTTLVKLIAGYLHPQSGQILVDGQALPTPQNCHSEGSVAEGRNQGSEELYSGSFVPQEDDHISLQSYYPHIGYLTQEPSVFDGTVWENLTYGLSSTDVVIVPSVGDKLGSEDTSDAAPEGSASGTNQLAEQGKENAPEGSTPGVDRHVVPPRDDEDLENKINNIIKLARCEFIYEFKDGLQTEIGEEGIRLSGGQRQRLAIAKIMLKGPDIILLDEPTSALDSENEELVTQALNELFRGKTVIVIAHRLQTVKHSDQILYIDGGQVVESGTHKELLAMKGKYYKMVELQSGF